MSHRYSPLQRRERGQRHRADLALGDLPVMLEQIVGKAGRVSDDARAGRCLNLDTDDIQLGDVAKIEAGGVRGPDALLGAAERFEHGEPRLAEPRLGQQPRQRLGALAVGGERQHARALMQMRSDAIERAPMQRDKRNVGQRPTEPCGRQTERRRRRHDQRLVGRDMVRQHRADAIEERIARGEHADLAPARGKHLFNPAREGTGPRLRLAADQRRGQREVPRAAEHDVGA